MVQTTQSQIYYGISINYSGASGKISSHYREPCVGEVQTSNV